MDSMEQRLDASFNALSTQILQSRRENDDAHLAMHARFEKIETAIADLRDEMKAQGTDLRAEMKAQGTDLRAEMKAQGTDLRAEMKAQGADLRDEMKAQGADLRAEMKAQGAGLRGAIREGDEETRRFMLILHEDTLSKIALIGEGRPSSS